MDVCHCFDQITLSSFHCQSFDVNTLTKFKISWTRAHPRGDSRLERSEGYSAGWGGHTGHVGEAAGGDTAGMEARCGGCDVIAQLFKSNHCTTVPYMSAWWLPVRHNHIKVKVPESVSHEDKVLQSRQLNLDVDSVFAMFLCSLRETLQEILGSLMGSHTPESYIPGTTITARHYKK